MSQDGLSSPFTPWAPHLPSASHRGSDPGGLTLTSAGSNKAPQGVGSQCSRDHQGMAGRPLGSQGYSPHGGGCRDRHWPPSLGAGPTLSSWP